MAAGTIVPLLNWTARSLNIPGLTWTVVLPPCSRIASSAAGNAAMWSQWPWLTAMHSISPSAMPRLAQLRMKIAPSGPVSNSIAWRMPGAIETNLQPKPRLAHSNASPDNALAPARTILANSETANSVLLT